MAELPGVAGRAGTTGGVFCIFRGSTPLSMVNGLFHFGPKKRGAR
jgi:hypothetical protein